jgi:hypothetical protein
MELGEVGMQWPCKQEKTVGCYEIITLEVILLLFQNKCNHGIKTLYRKEFIFSPVRLNLSAIPF